MSPEAKREVAGARVRLLQAMNGEFGEIAHLVRNLVQVDREAAMAGSLERLLIEQLLSILMPDELAAALRLLRDEFATAIGEYAEGRR